MTTTHTNLTRRGVFTAAVAIAASESVAKSSQEQFLADVQSDDPAKQLAAWKEAEQQEPGVIIPLGKLLASDKMSIAKCASQSIMKIVHSVGKTVDNPARKAVIDSLLELLKQDSKVIRTFAFRALALVAGSEQVPAIAPFLTDAELREEAVFCLERIPAEAAIDALIGSLAKVSDDFKPRVIAALGHRKAEKAMPAIENYMQSPNLDLALVTAKAIARIGVMPTADPPEFDQLNPRQKLSLLDSALRFCDEQIKRGELEFPSDFLVDVLSNEDDEIEEHVLCGAIVSASKLDTPEVAAAIVKQLGRPLYIVKDTAIKTLIAMKGSNVDAALNTAMSAAEGDAKKTLEEILAKRKGQ